MFASVLNKLNGVYDIMWSCTLTYHSYFTSMSSGSCDNNFAAGLLGMVCMIQCQCRAQLSPADWVVPRSLICFWVVYCNTFKDDSRTFHRLKKKQIYTSFEWSCCESVYCCKNKLIKIDPLLFLILYFLSEIVCASLVNITAFSCIAARAMFR